MDDEESLRGAIVTLAGWYGHGYRWITALLRRHRWQVNPKQVEHIWRQEGLKVPFKTLKPTDSRLTPILEIVDAKIHLGIRLFTSHESVAIENNLFSDSGI
jgi:hypothetical protein